MTVVRSGSAILETGVRDIIGGWISGAKEKKRVILIKRYVDLLNKKFFIVIVLY